MNASQPTSPDQGLPPAVRQEIAERVGAEILHQCFSPGAWAEALVAANTSQNGVTNEYARIRMLELSRHHRDSAAKAESLELRRLKSGRSALPKSVEDMLRQRANCRALPNSGRPEVPPALLASLFLGSAGSIGCLLRLCDNLITVPHTPAVALLCALSTVGAVLLLRATLPKTWLREGFHLMLSSVTMIACLLSLGLGARVLAFSTQPLNLGGGFKAAAHQVSSVPARGLACSVASGATGLDPAHGNR
jgi:hypothetical protein